MSRDERLTPSTRDAAADRRERLLGALTVALGAVAASTFLLAAPVRLAYPYEMEWLESETLQHVARSLDGLGLHAAPSAEFSSTIYPPLYAWVSALAARVVGLSFLAPRLVSALATLLVALLAARVAGGLAGSVRAALVALALVLSLYVPCGTVLDLARLDALWVLLLLAGAAAAAGAERPRRAALAGLLLGLATATKQPAALLALALTAWLAPRSRRAAAVLGGTWALVTAAYYGGLHWLSGGWSTVYLVELPLRVPHRPSALLHLIRDDLVGNFAPALALLLIWWATPQRERPGGPLPAHWWIALGAAGLMSASMRTLQGGAENTLLVGLVFLAVLAAAVAGRLLGHAGRMTRIAVLVLLALQFARLLYSPATLVPGRADRARAAALVERLRAYDGPVWIPSHTSYAHLAGKPFLVHRDPLLDLLYGRMPYFPEDLLEKLRAGAFTAVILDSPFVEERLQAALEQGYEAAASIDDPPVPRTGYRTAPSVVYLPRRVRAAAGG